MTESESGTPKKPRLRVFTISVYGSSCIYLFLNLMLIVSFHLAPILCVAFSIVLSLKLYLSYLSVFLSISFYLVVDLFYFPLLFFFINLSALPLVFI